MSDETRVATASDYYDRWARAYARATKRKEAERTADEDAAKVGESIFAPGSGDVDIDVVLAECLEVFRSKGTEYTVGSSDRLANFRGAAADTGLSMEQVWYVFFNKHVRALASYVKHGRTFSEEPIRGRVKDAIVYLLLFSKILAEAK